MRLRDIFITSKFFNMVIVRASLGFKRDKPSDKGAFGGNVITALNADAASPDPVFTDLPVTLKAITDSNVALIKANQEALNGGRAFVQAKRDAVAAWDVTFTKVAAYVSTVANGSASIVILANFVPTKSGKQKSQVPGLAIDFKAVAGEVKREITFGSKKGAPGAKASIVTALPPGATLSFSGDMAIINIGEQKIYFTAYTSKDSKLTTLTSGTEYSVTQFSVNSAGLSPATAVQSVIPQ